MQRDTVAVLFLVCSAMLAAWLGIAGPIDLSVFQPWQTLIGACVALTAALIAYRAAMLKISADRQSEANREQRRVTGIFIRLRLSLELLGAEVLLQQQIINPNQVAIIQRSDLEKIFWPAELDEAWQNLDLFPIEIAQAIGGLRAHRDYYRRMLDGFTDADEWTVGPQTQRGPVLALFDSLLVDFLAAIETTQTWIQAALEQQGD